MGSVFKRVVIVLVIPLSVLLALGGLVVLRFAYVGGAFDSIKYRAVAGCTAEILRGSAEDVEVDHSTGIAYLSVLDRRAAVNDARIVGTILQLDLTQAGAHLKPATVGDPPGFRPHGLSLWARTDEPRRLFVVNHALGVDRSEDQTVEIFEQQSDQLFHHQRSVRDALFVHPNDIAAVGPDQFYVANDSGAHHGFTRALEFVFQLGWSTLVYYDGTQASVAVADRATVNGVAASADGLKIFVAETAARQVLIFDRDTETGSLYWSGLVELPGEPDNLDLAEDGSLWVAAHPDIWAVMRNASTGTPAPTMILKIAAPVNGYVKPQSIYVNDGTEISVGSVGVAFRGRLVIGSFMDKKLLLCPLPTPAN